MRQDETRQSKSENMGDLRVEGDFEFLYVRDGVGKPKTQARRETYVARVKALPCRRRRPLYYESYCPTPANIY